MQAERGAEVLAKTFAKWMTPSVTLPMVPVPQQPQEQEVAEGARPAKPKQPLVQGPLLRQPLLLPSSSSSSPPPVATTRPVVLAAQSRQGEVQEGPTHRQCLLEMRVSCFQKHDHLSRRTRFRAST
jgi:hypothetical protein